MTQTTAQLSELLLLVYHLLNWHSKSAYAKVKHSSIRTSPLKCHEMKNVAKRHMPLKWLPKIMHEMPSTCGKPYKTMHVAKKRWMLDKMVNFKGVYTLISKGTSCTFHENFEPFWTFHQMSVSPLGRMLHSLAGHSFSQSGKAKKFLKYSSTPNRSSLGPFDSTSQHTTLPSWMYQLSDWDTSVKIVLSISGQLILRFH